MKSVNDKKLKVVLHKQIINIQLIVLTYYYYMTLCAPNI